MKTCPFCAEEIKDAARVCRYCLRSLPLADTTDRDQLAEMLVKAPRPPAFPEAESHVFAEDIANLARDVRNLIHQLRSINKSLFTMEEAAVFLGIKKSAMGRLIRHGKIHFVRLPLTRGAMFQRAQLERLIEDCVE